MKTFLIILVIAAVAGWAVWYQFIRQKSLGEKIDDASRKVEKSVNDAVKKVTP
ncbi:MAG: FeoB-associated Cys-rich membrane protein [Verrucomicrobia bacterium]|nr:FeoB-associated Cys-rich membrane protein [Verrucomicrobiota bacterium]